MRIVSCLVGGLRLIFLQTVSRVSDVVLSEFYSARCTLVSVGKVACALPWICIPVGPPRRLILFVKFGGCVGTPGRCYREVLEMV